MIRRIATGQKTAQTYFCDWSNLLNIFTFQPVAIYLVYYIPCKEKVNFSKIWYG